MKPDRTLTFERRYVAVDGRRVHYRRVGQGPPAVFLHASPANSEMVRAEMLAAAPHFTCFAFDTPGFGESDPLPGETLQVADLARATAAAMLAVGLPPCPVYGTHTGAAVGLELGAGWPERVTGLVLEGIPIFYDEEIAAWFGDYFSPFAADPLGGHLTSIWVRFRDQFTWFPWNARDAARMNPTDRPSPEDIHHWVMMYNRCRKTYVPAYRAACTYGVRAVATAAALSLPAVFMTSAQDMLFGHLERLPPLRPQQRLERFRQGDAAKHRAIVDWLRALAEPAPRNGWAAGTPRFELVGSDPALQFVESPTGQVLIRCYGKRGNPAVILLHDAPGTGLALETLARQLAEEFAVIVPDLPGNGESEGDSDELPILEACADAVGAIADSLELGRVAIAAIGCGCAVAATFASRRDPRLSGVIACDTPFPDRTVSAAIAPDIPLSAAGAHWVTMWLMLRDAQIYRPWYDGRIASQRRRQGNFDADYLHEQTVALMKSRATYQRLPRAAHRVDTRAALREAAVPVQLGVEDDLAQLVRRHIAAFG